MEGKESWLLKKYFNYGICNYHFGTCYSSGLSKWCSWRKGCNRREGYRSNWNKGGSRK